MTTATTATLAEIRRSRQAGDLPTTEPCYLICDDTRISGSGEAVIIDGWRAALYYAMHAAWKVRVYTRYPASGPLKGRLVSIRVLARAQRRYAEWLIEHRLVHNRYRCDQWGRLHRSHVQEDAADTASRHDESADFAADKARDHIAATTYALGSAATHPSTKLGQKLLADVKKMWARCGAQEEAAKEIRTEARDRAEHPRTRPSWIHAWDVT